MVANAILLESGLSFLGLGDPNLMSWGFMIGAGRSVIRLAWWMSVFPGLAIFLTVLALNLVGEGLGDALNPRLARRRMSLLAVEDLTIALPPGGDRTHAVSGVSFTLDAGEVLCIVGESGSGKSVSAGAIMGLLPAGAAARERAHPVRGPRRCSTCPKPRMRALRGARLGMIFQEPMTALNPLMRVATRSPRCWPCTAPRRRHAGGCAELLAAVNLPDPVRLARAYPHLLSGGQRQRVMIADGARAGAARC